MAHRLRLKNGFTLPYTEQYTSFTVQAELELEFDDEEDLPAVRQRISDFLVEELNRQIEQVNATGPDIVGRRVTTREITKTKATRVRRTKKAKRT